MDLYKPQAGAKLHLFKLKNGRLIKQEKAQKCDQIHNIDC
jgi:hypothetical protein